MNPVKRQENFDRWFGCSKIRDAQGEPLVVYHGSRSALDVVEGDRFWVTPSKDLASSLNGRRRKAYALHVLANNPFDPCNASHVSLVADAFDRLYKNSTFNDWRNRIQGHWKVWDDRNATDIVGRAGFDAIASEEDGARTLLLIGGVVGRVKSADNNRGHFDPTSPDIHDGLPGKAWKARQFVAVSALKKAAPHA